MEALFNDDWSLWGPIGEAALPWTEGAPLDLEWLSKPGKGLADGTKPETEHAEDLWVPLEDLVNDADFEDWMEIKMDGDDLSAFSSSFLPESDDLFPPAVAPSSPQGELLGKIEQQPEAEVPVAVVVGTDDVTTAVTREAAILFSSMLDMTMTSSSSSIASSPSPSNAPASPERPSSRDSSFSTTDSSADSISERPSLEVNLELFSFYQNSSSEANMAAGESSPESATSKRARSSRKSPRASSSRPKSARRTGDIKIRKRDQNRDAATRYREKKRAESDILRIEEEKLERKNDELRDRVDGLSSEIKYLKGLMKEMIEARQKR